MASDTEVETVTDNAEIPPQEPQANITISFPIVENAVEYQFWVEGSAQREWLFPQTFLRRLFRLKPKSATIPAGPSKILFTVDASTGQMYEYGNIQHTVKTATPEN